ncbi:MAG: RagB/SusD family nutrient uptake outer membrane protein [Cyclobacteriaceae bacterium]
MKAYKILFLLTLLVSISSCNDFFELDRPPQPPWSTVTELERAPIGAYASLFSGHEWNMAWVNERILKSSMGDDVGFVRNDEWGYNRKTKENNFYTNRNFSQLYRVIAIANNALDFIVTENNGNPYPGISVEQRVNNVDRIVGELHFMRGYAYYILQTTFGHAYVPGGANSTIDIPMPTTFAKTTQEARNPKMGTTQEVYDLILADFVKAKELLPEKFDGTIHHPSYQVRANKFAAAGMLVRTYLQRGEYNLAIQECDFIIDQNNGEYDLTEDPIEAFNKNTLDRGREVIFYAPFFNTELNPPNHLSVLNNTWGGEYTTWVETHMALSTVTRLGFMDNPNSDTTINITARRDKRFTQLMAVRYPYNNFAPGQLAETRVEVRDITTILTNKYYLSGANTNVPLIRLAEIYLTRSILRLRANDALGAAQDLNAVRARAWDEEIGGPYVQITAGTITEQMINDERVIEMLNEGDRIDYLRGIKVPIPKGDRGIGTDPYTSEDFVWAIPVLELNFNDGI